MLQPTLETSPDSLRTSSGCCCGRVILHCVQFVLLLCLLVAEVIIQQHQLLQKSSFGSSNGALPVTARANGGAYQRLPGSAAEFDDKQKQRHQELLQPPEKFSAWWVWGFAVARAAAACAGEWFCAGQQLSARLLGPSQLSARKPLLRAVCTSRARAHAAVERSMPVLHSSADTSAGAQVIAVSAWRCQHFTMCGQRRAP